jgi:uncharacterized protein RhaS with RHS repeats
MAARLSTTVQPMTAVYEVDQAGTSKTLTYDANGNMTSDGTLTFEWDARNQLVAVNAGTHRSESSHDGLQRRVRAIEKENGVEQSETRVCSGAVEFASRSSFPSAQPGTGACRSRPSGS